MTVSEMSNKGYGHKVTHFKSVKLYLYFENVLFQKLELSRTK